MIKREFRINFKSFIIWLLILLVMFLIVYLIYPYIITDDTMKNLDELMKVFPPEILKVFNMDMSSIETAYGWFKSEGFIFVLLIIGIYSSMLGANILLKENSDKTIEYLGCLPIKRSKIVLNKIVVGITYIIIMILILGIFNFIFLSLSGSFEHKQFVLLSITPIFTALPLFFINLFISTFFSKNKNMLVISLGFVFINYLLNTLSELSSNVKFIRYFSIYTLADVRNVISDIRINPNCILISLIITIIFIVATFIRYDKKELI